MVKRAIGWIVVVSLLSAGGAWALRTYCPGLWTQVDRRAAELAGWNEAARQADPVGFVEYARGKLQKDLETMQKIRRELAAEIGSVSEKIRQLEALRDQAHRLADEFRTKYQEALAAKRFPIQVRGAAYSQDQAKAQVSMLLAEADGYEASLAHLNQVRQQAERQLETLTVQINQTEAQLAALGAQREILRVRSTAKVQADLVAKVEALMNENAQVLAANPVRSVRELLAAVEKPEDRQIQEARVEAFLASHPVARPADSAGSEGPSCPAEQASPAQPVSQPKVGPGANQPEPKPESPTEPPKPIQPVNQPQSVDQPKPGPGANPSEPTPSANQPKPPKPEPAQAKPPQAKPERRERIARAQRPEASSATASRQPTGSGAGRTNVQPAEFIEELPAADKPQPDAPSAEKPTEAQPAADPPKPIFQQLPDQPATKPASKKPTKPIYQQF